MKHCFHTIPGWFSFRAIYEQAVREARDGAHFIEVGSWKGRSAAFMAVEIINSGKRIRFDCVDTWLGSDEPKHNADPDVQQGKLFQTFVNNTRPVHKAINIVHMPSTLAAQRYDGFSLDFVFIDAAHDYANVKADIAAWLPTVKPGGVIAGDDYNKREVAQAVRDSCLDFEVIKGSGNGQQWRVRVDA